MTSCLFCLCLSAAVGMEQAPAPKAPPPSPPAEQLPGPPNDLLPRVLLNGLPPSSAACLKPISLCDFCRSFKPAPGKYEVLFIHPVKGCPVWVCFDLPPGNPKVCCGKRTIVFDYGCKTVVIRFKVLCGGVRVDYY